MVRHIPCSSNGSVLFPRQARARLPVEDHADLIGRRTAEWLPTLRRLISSGESGQRGR